jgi:hypothetical protein
MGVNFDGGYRNTPRKQPTPERKKVACREIIYGSYKGINKHCFHKFPAVNLSPSTFEKLKIFIILLVNISHVPHF